MVQLTRRNVILASVASLVVTPQLSMALESPPIHVVKGTGCECYEAWVAYLKDQGFAVTEEERYGTLLIRFKMDLGIPAKVYSCHTGVIDDYALEGHVPADDIRRLLAERPDAIGLAVPGMPAGSPGMGSEDYREAYEVLLIRRDGSTEVFRSYAAAEG